MGFGTNATVAAGVGAGTGRWWDAGGVADILGLGVESVGVDAGVGLSLKDVD
ncbi:MAG: hypothetical protein WCD18_25155 [Thermosynechococcaceae cyanobacterium]